VPVPDDGAALERLHREAVQFALQRGSRSGRIAWQFARAQAGARALDGGKAKGRNKSTK
jgi:predicted AAA+ superfamily ATPase